MIDGRPPAVSSQETKAYLVNWINMTIKTKYLHISSLEQLATGVTYCELLNILYPNRIQIAKVYIRPKNDYEVDQNFKLLASAFQKIGLKQM
jgi:RP/EB family microtubule-associated protein